MIIIDSLGLDGSVFHRIDEHIRYKFGRNKSIILPDFDFQKFILERHWINISYTDLIFELSLPKGSSFF